MHGLTKRIQQTAVKLEAKKRNSVDLAVENQKKHCAKWLEVSNFYRHESKSLCGDLKNPRHHRICLYSADKTGNIIMKIYRCKISVMFYFCKCMD